MSVALNSNSIAIIDREIASGSIEGVHFGPRVWVIARSPSAVLIWVFGHSWSNNGHQNYAQPHLTLLPDRTPRFIHNPHYVDLRRQYSHSKLKADLLAMSPDATVFLIDTFGSNALSSILEAVQKRKTVIIEDGGGPLKPLHLYGHEHRDWVERHGNGFIVVPDGMKPYDMYRHKLGWKPA